MAVRLSTFKEVVELERVQRQLGFSGGQEMPADDVGYPWTYWRRVAQHIVFGETWRQIATPAFIQTFAAPSTSAEACEFADARGFDLTFGKAVLIDWFAWSVMIGACSAGLTKRSVVAVERNEMDQIEQRLANEARAFRARKSAHKSE